MPPLLKATAKLQTKLLAVACGTLRMRLRIKNGMLEMRLHAVNLCSNSLLGLFARLRFSHIIREFQFSHIGFDDFHVFLFILRTQLVLDGESYAFSTLSEFDSVGLCHLCSIELACRRKAVGYLVVLLSR